MHVHETLSHARRQDHASQMYCVCMSGDLFFCPECGVKVVSGLGNEPVAEHFQKGRYAKFVKGTALRFWNTLQEMREFSR